jgi:hypothetical protein
MAAWRASRLARASVDPASGRLLTAARSDVRATAVHGPAVGAVGAPLLTLTGGVTAVLWKLCVALMGKTNGCRAATLSCSRFRPRPESWPYRSGT